MTATEPQTLGQLTGHAIAGARDRQRLSARAMAIRLAEGGWPSIDRQRIANLESGRGRSVSVDELLGLAWVLRENSPVDVLLGSPEIDLVTGDAEVWAAVPVQIAPDVALTRDAVAKWFGDAGTPWDFSQPGTVGRVSEGAAMSAIRHLAKEFGLKVTFEDARGRSRG